MAIYFFCLRKQSQQMCVGFGTEGAKISLWGLENVHFIFMGQHLHKFVPDVWGLLQKCHIVPAHAYFQETLLRKAEAPPLYCTRCQFLAWCRIGLCNPFTACCAVLFKSHDNWQRERESLDPFIYSALTWGSLLVAPVQSFIRHSSPCILQWFWHCFR